MSDPIRILLLADSHLGFDLPTRARIERRRRGHDFLANYTAALAPALSGEVDLVVHGGDVFHRSRVPTSLAWEAFEPLARVARGGVPVYVVPGNHERGRIPQLRFAQQPGIHVFDRPRTFIGEVRGTRVAIAGFPSERHDVRSKFAELVESTAWCDAEADVRVLCMHQCVEGATVGPANFTFTTAPDVIRGADVPAGFAAVLSGHIHRQQVLVRDLRGRPLAAPVLYPGSIERTSVAEADEKKGYLIVELGRAANDVRVRWRTRSLPARPLVRRDLSLESVPDDELEPALRSLIDDLPADAVLNIRVSGTLTDHAMKVLSGANLRRLVPPTMNVQLSGAGAGRPPRTSRRPPAPGAALELPLWR